MIKTKEMIVDYRKRRTEDAPILIDGAVVEQVKSFKFFGVHITKKLTMVEAHQDSCDKGTTKPIPPQETDKIWHGSSDPQKVIQLHHREHPDWLHHRLVWQLLGLRPQVITGYITGAKLPAIQDFNTRRCQRKALKIVKDSSQPSHRRFSLLPHGMWYRSIKSRSKRLLNSFYPQTIRLLNN